MSLAQQFLNIGIEIKAMLLYAGLSLADMTGISIHLPFLGANKIALTLVGTLLLSLITKLTTRSGEEKHEVSPLIGITSEFTADQLEQTDEIILSRTGMIAVRREE